MHSSPYGRFRKRFLRVPSVHTTIVLRHCRRENPSLLERKLPADFRGPRLGPWMPRGNLCKLRSELAAQSGRLAFIDPAAEVSSCDR